MWVVQVTQHLPPTTLRHILDLQNRIARERQGGSDSKSSSAGGESSALDSLGLVSGRKLAQASVQGLDQLRKLVIPDALVTVIGGTITGAVGRDRAAIDASSAAANNAGDGGGAAKKGREERLREELDDLLASSCVYCDMAIVSLDRPFLADGEEEI